MLWNLQVNSSDFERFIRENADQFTSQGDRITMSMKLNMAEIDIICRYEPKTNPILASATVDQLIQNLEPTSIGKKKNAKTS